MDYRANFSKGFKSRCYVLPDLKILWHSRNLYELWKFVFKNVSENDEIAYSTGYLM